MATSGSLGRAVNVAVGAVTGHGAAPGELRTITSAEVSLVLKRVDEFLIGGVLLMQIQLVEGLRK